jgi:CheY-like chemotaxis protein
MKILIVDDDADYRDLLVPVLQDHGYEVATAGSGRDAVGVLEKGEPIDIIVSDIVMPVMNGFHLLSYLKAEAHFSRIPVILYTSLNDEESVRKGLALGAVDYVTKPISAEALVSKIKNVEKKVPGAVLVVDDEELLRKLLKNILQRDGLRVLLAESALEALDMLEKNKVAVVVTDIAMPEMNGLELLVTVKDRHPTIPVLLVTGQGGKYGREDVLAAGADGYVTKPFRATEMLRQIRPYIR